MPFQISIGDAILLAQIAWRLAQTFTKGRQSAPAAFYEIENELHSLSAALTAVESERSNMQLSTDETGAGSNQHTTNHDILGRIIQNCKRTLEHLEEIVKKYTIVSEQTDPKKPKLERWSHSFLKNWKKIEWTTEKGDLNTLRSQIMVHTNSLNLLVNIGTSTRTASIERSLDKKLALLEELHEWYVDNLKETKPKRKGTPTSHIQESGSTTFIRSLDIVPTFELTRKGEAGDEIICPRASVRSEWIESFMDGDSGPSSGSMFVCNCLDDHSVMLPHQPIVQRYGLSHLIFPIRIASDEGSWILYKTADRESNQLVNLCIRKIHPRHIRHLEDTFFGPLSRRRGAAIIAQGKGNSLCYISADNQEEHLLQAMSELEISRTSVESITFRSGQTHHVQEWVTDVQIFQYGVRSSEASIGNLGVDLIQSLDYAEILISFDASEAQARSDVVSMVLKLRRNTVMVLTDKASVEIKSIQAVGAYLDERRTTYDGLDVTIQFITRLAAKEFYENIQSMRKDLFVRSLRSPRSNEKIVLRLQAARVECESLYIDDAEIAIVMDTNANYRLIIASRNGCTTISQVLVEDFFTSSPNQPNFTGSTYVVQVGDTGERKLYHYKNGFRHLSLSTTQANRMLELARSSVRFGIQNIEE
ncbi:hypothetical protein F5Y10DRAFT_255810 [Nemania abortiva]|nr:hypothetical protein F5Y10DRAFT_255810 [Nemania abortiva]